MKTFRLCRLQKSTYMFLVLYFSIVSSVFADTELSFYRSDYHFSNPWCTGLDVGDVDNDGDIDIAMVSNFAGDFIYINNGVDAFDRMYLGTGGNYRVDVVLVDFDSDGDLDFSWGNGGQENNNGTFEFTSFLDVPFIRAVVFADFNADGYPDAAGHGFMDGTGSIAINHQGKGFQITQNINEENEEYEADAGDIDNDGDIDIAVGNKIWINDGTGVFTDSQINLTAGNSSVLYDRDFADLNNDGYIDIVIAERHHGCYVMLNDKNGSFVWDGKRITTSFNIAVGDIDKDGYIDIVTSHPFHIYLNDRSGGFGAPAYMDPSAGTNAPGQDVEVADLDGDGYLDIILSDWKPEGFNGIGTPKVFYQIVPVIYVDIDIKPNSFPNAINLGSHGLIPIAILSSLDFDATTVDPETVELAGSGIKIRGKSNKYMVASEDVNDDGLPDIVVHVAIENFDPDTFQDGYATLAGKTFDGEIIEGTDEISIVPHEHLGSN